MEFGHILIATDLMSPTRQVYGHAVSIARAYGARITLLHVNEPLNYSVVQTTEYLEYLELLGERVARSLQEECETLAERGVQVEVAESVGNPPREILDFIDTDEVDLVILARHRDSYRLVGSTIQRVVRHVEIPTLIIDVEPDALPREFDGYNQILATTDFSEDSERGFEAACAFAARVDASLTLAHVLKLPSAIAALPGEPLLQFPRASVDESVAALQRDLERIMSSGTARRLDHHLSIDENAARGLLRAAEELDVDLIVIPTHGKGAVRAMLFGSTSERVLRLSTRPIMLLPRKYLEIGEG